MLSKMKFIQFVRKHKKKKFIQFVRQLKKKECKILQNDLRFLEPVQGRQFNCENANN